MDGGRQQRHEPGTPGNARQIEWVRTNSIRHADLSSSAGVSGHGSRSLLDPGDAHRLRGVDCAVHEPEGLEVLRRARPHVDIGLQAGGGLLGRVFVAVDRQNRLGSGVLVRTTCSSPSPSAWPRYPSRVRCPSRGSRLRPGRGRCLSSRSNRAHAVGFARASPLPGSRRPPARSLAFGTGPCKRYDAITSEASEDVRRSGRDRGGAFRSSRHRHVNIIPSNVRPFSTDGLKLENRRRRTRSRTGQAKPDRPTYSGRKL